MPIAYRDTSIGTIGIAEHNGKITHLFFEIATVPAELELGESPLLDEAFKQLDEYLSGARKDFDLPLDPHGTEWQLKCWNALLEIPYGETATYGDIAKKVNNPKGFRAVGLANNRNPIAVFIPCHRVIGANGSLTGFGGGLDVKDKLLKIEQTTKNSTIGTGVIIGFGVSNS